MFGSGKDTHVFELEMPLTFKILSLSVKGGHIIVLSEGKPGKNMEFAVRDQFICQRVVGEFHSWTRPSLEKDGAWNAGRQWWYHAGSKHMEYIDERSLGKIPREKYLEYDFLLRRYIVWSEYCG